MLAVTHRFAALATMAFIAFPVAAQQSNPVESRLEARKVVVGADGKESQVAADAAGPGDVIEYRASYRNTGRQAVRQLEATLPIPANTELLPDSVRPATAKASLDAKAFGAMPLKRTVQRDGRAVEETVPVREYRYLRWYPGELGADKTLTFTARVRVIDDRAPPAPAKGSPR